MLSPSTTIEGFGEPNTKDLSAVLKELNTAAHGPAVQFALPQLTVIMTSVADAIGFVCLVVAE